MSEVLNILFHPLPNAIMTFLTGLSLIYWILNMLMGDGHDFDSTNVDIDFDGSEVQDIDHDSDVSHDHEAIEEPSFFSKAIDYINIGKAPLMVIVTLFQFIGWMITIASSVFLKLNEYGWKSVLILIPILLLTYFLMHYVTIPVVKLYNNVGYTGEEAYDFLGKNGMMRSSIQDSKIGSAEFKIGEDIIRLNVKSYNGEPLKYGDEVSVVNGSEDKKYYYVQKNITINNF